MDSIQGSYDALLAAVFKNAYDELVENIRKAKREEERKAKAPTLQMRAACSRIIYIEKWILDAAPNWINIDAEKIIKWAHEEAGDET